MFVHGPGIRHDLSNILANIGHVSQSEPLVSIFDNSMVNVDHVAFIGPSGWNLGNEDLEPAAHVDDCIGQTGPLDDAENVKLLLTKLVTMLKVLSKGQHNLILDVDNSFWRWPNPLRRYKSLHTGFLCGFNPWYLKIQVFPGDTRDEDIDSR